MKLTFNQRDCLEWAVSETIGLEPFRARICGSKPLNIKLGIDPTSPNIHLGRTIPLWRLRAFQSLGHHIHLIIGSFTAQIGDTSDKESERPMLTSDQVRANMQPYLAQIWRILDPLRQDQVHIHYNDEWLSPLTLGQISSLADHFSVNAFIKRELVAKRLESGGRVSLREMLYPLMQGYDSLVVEADIEIGGTDQRFNLLAGRALQEGALRTPQGIIMNTLVAGTDGRKMSSSWGNVISLLDQPEEMFGKTMSIPDSLIGEYLNFLPFCVQPFSLLELQNYLEDGANPRDLKLQLASCITGLYYSEATAQAAKEAFQRQFTDQKPTEELRFSDENFPLQLLDIITTKTNWSESRSELRRVFLAGGIELDNQKIFDYQHLLEATNLPVTLKVGKRILVQLVT